MVTEVAAAVAAAGAELPAGVGVGWRPEIAGWVAGRSVVGFCEVLAEALAPTVLPRGVAELRERGVAVIPHGVRLSLGGAEPVDAGRITHLAACATALGAPLVSEHVAFVRAGGREAGHLLPVPRTREALDVLTANVRRTQSELDVPLALEPIAALFDWPEDEYSETDFLTELLERTGALLLLDVANIHANARNRGQDARSVLDRMPLDRIAYVHIAGGAVREGLYHDTHTDPMPDPVLDLLERLVERAPTTPAVMLERDGRYPPAAELNAELDAIAARLPDVRGEPAVGPPPHPVRVRPTPDPPRSAPPPAGSGLARGQAELVAALVAGAPLPIGFDADRLDATRSALLRKRAGEAAKAWPLLAASAGTDWVEVFSGHARDREPAGAVRDGWDLARELAAGGRLGPGAAGELAEREARWRYDGRSAPKRRRLPALYTMLVKAH